MAANTDPRSAPAARAEPPIWLVLAAFASIYVIWGSTYLAIRIAVQTLPPLWMASARFLVAGGLLYAVVRAKGAPRPLLVHWRSAMIVGGLMLLGGNGGVVVAETMVDSGIAALLVATVPLWMVLLNALRPGGVRPNMAEVAGLLIGFVGVWTLIGPRSGTGVNPLGAGLLLFASFTWSAGSLYSRHAPLPQSPLLATAMEMLGGGVALALAGMLRGEWVGVRVADFSLASVAALAYLVVFGSLIAFSAYIWLLRVTTPAKAGTYAYVNPLVAVLLGWAVLREPLSAHTFVAMALIVASAALITRYGRRRTPIAAPSPAPLLRNTAPYPGDST